jgi:hypothetical protein
VEVAKLIIEVQAGVILEQPMPEHTRRWTWTSTEQERLSAGDPEAQAQYLRIAGESREYAAWLEHPGRVNWVKRIWIWL